MSASTVIKKIMLDKKIPVRDLASKLGLQPQVLSNKLYRDTFTYDEYVKIANILDCDVKTIARGSKTVYDNDYEEKSKK